ncbi:MAG TPA: hypothetical protein VGH71_04835 [Gammaproteobacteria bacterium]|jgi:hypothetical protein
MKKKAVSRKKQSPARKAAGRKGATRKAAARKAPKQKASAKSARAPSRKKKTKSRAGKRVTPPLSRPQPVPPGNEQAPQLAGEEDEHGPMHIPSHKPAPAYAEMHKRDWAGQPPSDIPIPKH